MSETWCLRRDVAALEAWTGVLVADEPTLEEIEELALRLMKIAKAWRKELRLTTPIWLYTADLNAALAKMESRS